MSIDRDRIRGYFRSILNLETLLCLVVLLVTLLSVTVKSDQKKTEEEKLLTFSFSPRERGKTEKATDRELNDIIKALEKVGKQRTVKGLSDKTKEVRDNLIPAGDMYFMRWANGEFEDFIQNHPKILKYFQAAHIASDYIKKRKILLDISKMPDASLLVKYRAYIGISRNAFRFDRGNKTAIEEGCKFARKALQLYNVPGNKSPWLSDAYYLLARCAYEGERDRKKAIELLDLCLKRDESFLEAQQMLLTLLAENFVIAPPKDTRQLLKNTLWLIRAAKSVTELTRNINDFIQLADQLAPMAYSPYVALVTGFCYLEAGDFKQARDILSQIDEGEPENDAMKEILKVKKDLMSHLDNQKK